MNKADAIDYNKYINYFFIGFAFSIPISKALTSTFIALLIITWILEGSFKDKFSIIKHNKLTLSIYLLITFSFISIFWSYNLSYSLEFNIGKYWHFLIVPIILTSFNKHYIKYVINAFLISMFISEIVSYGIFFELWSYDNKPPSDPSPFMDHTIYSTFLAFTLILIISKLYKEKDLKWKVFYTIYFLTALSNLFINGGRTGQVGFLATILIISLIFYLHSYKTVIASIVFVILTLTTAYNFSPNFHDRVNQLEKDIEKGYYQENYNGSMSRRYALWRIGANIFLDSPIYGHGIMGDIDLRNKYLEEYNFKVDTFKGYLDYHNAFVQYAVQLGILGLLFYVFIFISLFTLKFKQKEHKILAVSFSTIFLSHSAVGFAFGLMDPAMLFCVFASLFNAISYRDSLEANAR